MTAISHVIIGASLAAKIHDPVTVGVVSFGMHLIADYVPHWDLGTNWRTRPKIVTGALAISETLLALIGGYWIFSRFVPNNFVLVVAMTASLLPDWLEVPYYMTMPNSHPFFYSLYKIQSKIHGKRLAPKIGILTQILVVLFFLWLGFFA